MRTRSDASDTFSTTSGTSRPHILLDFADTEVSSEGDEWFPGLANLVDEDSTPRPDPGTSRRQPRLLCEAPGCDLPQIMNEWCPDHYMESLPEWNKYRIRWAKANQAAQARTKDEPDPALPKLAHLSPGKPKKLPKQVALYFASAGKPDETLQDLSDPIPNYKVRKSSVFSAIEEVDEGTTPIYESRYIRNHRENPNTLDFRTIPEYRDFSTDERRDPREVLAEITYSSFTHPWPGRHGPRDAMVLSGVLRECWHRRSLGLDIALMQFGPEVGLVSYEGIRDALTNLERIGYFGFVLGKEDDWKPGGEMGRPSKITLNPRTNPTGTFWPTNLPLPSLDLFSYDELGPGGWLILASIIIASRLGEFDDQKYSDQPVLGIADLVRLTGMNKGRTIEVMKNMVENGPAFKRDRKYQFYNLADLSDRHTYSDYKTRDRREKLALDRKRRSNHYRPPKPEEPAEVVMTSEQEIDRQIGTSRT